MNYNGDYMIDRHQTMRDMKLALAYLDSRPHAIFCRHRLAWPQSLLETKLCERQERMAALCAPWFDNSAFVDGGHA